MKYEYINYYRVISNYSQLTDVIKAVVSGGSSTGPF
jgi:hypothetical protein